MKKKEETNPSLIGTQNYKMKDCPFHLPKENLKFFKQMQKASQQSTVSTYGNSYAPDSLFSNKDKVGFTNE